MRSFLVLLFGLGLQILLTGSFAFAQPQTQLPNTTRSGSSGSSGTTQQGPPYDTGIRGPNSPMGVPDTTAVEKESSGAITRKRKKPVGQIRVDADPGITPTPSPSPSPTPPSL
jgi:hypothetical protein